MQQLRLPLNEIPQEATDEAVRRVLKRGTIQAPVDVARFGSAI